jgi:hypothetical protein
MGGCTRTCFIASFLSFSFFLCSDRSSIRGGVLNNEMGRKGKRSQRFERERNRDIAPQTVRKE